MCNSVKGPGGGLPILQIFDVGDLQTLQHPTLAFAPGDKLSDSCSVDPLLEGMHGFLLASIQHFQYLSALKLAGTAHNLLRL